MAVLKVALRKWFTLAQILTIKYQISILSSDAARVWAGRVLAQPEFGSLVNPIATRGADYALLITASPPGFENPAASLHSIKILEQ